MNDGQRVWRLMLMRSGEPVAELVVNGGDFPWLNAEVRAGAAYENIRSEVRLCYPDGRVVPEFLLHIRGEDAWWRWSDEPFTHIETDC